MSVITAIGGVAANTSSLPSAYCNSRSRQGRSDVGCTSSTPQPPDPAGTPRGQLRSRLGVFRTPHGRVQPLAPRAHAQVQRCARRRAGHGRGCEHAPALAAVLADDHPAVLDRHAQVLERARPAQQEPGPQRRIGDGERRQLLALGAVMVGQEHRHGLVCGRAREAARHREHGGAVRDRHALVVQRRPFLAPSPARRPGREVAAVRVPGRMQGRPRGAALRELPRRQRGGRRRGRGPADRLRPGQPAGRAAHRNGVLRQV